MNNEERRAWLKGQIKLRAEVLAEWLEGGVPDGAEIPKSLTRVRLWRNENLGIEAIGSPSSFSTRHRLHGNSVAGIQRTLVLLHAKSRRRPAAKRPTGLRRDKEVIERLEASLRASASQALALRAEAKASGRHLRLSESREKGLERRVRELESELLAQRREGAPEAPPSNVRPLRVKENTDHAT